MDLPASLPFDLQFMTAVPPATPRAAPGAAGPAAPAGQDFMEALASALRERSADAAAGGELLPPTGNPLPSLPLVAAPALPGAASGSLARPAGSELALPPAAGGAVTQESPIALSGALTRVAPPLAADTPGAMAPGGAVAAVAAAAVAEAQAPLDADVPLAPASSSTTPVRPADAAAVLSAPEAAPAPLAEAPLLSGAADELAARRRALAFPPQLQGTAARARAAAAEAPPLQPAELDLKPDGDARERVARMAALPAAAEPQSPLPGAAAPAPALAAPAPTAEAAEADAGPPAVIDVDSPRSTEMLATRIRWLVDHGRDEATLKLNPPELGALDIKISLVDDKTHVQLVAQNAAARDLIEQTLPRLREMLAHGGLDVGGTNVSDGRGGGQATPPVTPDGPAADELGVSPHAPPSSRAESLVDLYA